MVGINSMMQVSSQTPIPEGQGAVFSILAPRNAPCDLVFPGIVWPNNFGPLDLPHSVADTWGQCYHVLRQTHESILKFIAQVRRSLTPWQLEEIESPLITLYTMRDHHMRQKRVSRAMFFRVMHPTFNPLIMNAEAVFLGGACYSLYKFQYNTMATTIDNLLQSPHLDTYVCQKMLASGWLDREACDDEAFHFLERYEDLAQGDQFVEEGEEIY